MIYILLIAVVLVSQLIFWSVGIYLVVRWFRRPGNLSPEQKLVLLAQGMQVLSNSGGSSGPGPVESNVRSMAAREGIDLGS